MCFSAPGEALHNRCHPPPQENTFFLTFSAYSVGLSGKLFEDINISVLVHKMKPLKPGRGCLSKRSADRGRRNNVFFLSKGGYRYIILFPPLFWSQNFYYLCCVEPHKEATVLRVPVNQKCDHKVLYDQYTFLFFEIIAAVIAKINALSAPTQIVSRDIKSSCFDLMFQLYPPCFKSMDFLP